MKIFFSFAGILIVLLLVGVWWSRSDQSSASKIISSSGIHWHPELEIYVDGEKIEIPPNTGLMGGENPIHTHEDLPLIHLEFSGIVRENNIMLGRFFEVWGEDFRGFGENLIMTINGIENTEFENYKMQDKDKIVLRYSN